LKPLGIVLAMIEPPLPFGSAAGRWYYVLLKGLVERGHKVSAFATCSKPDEIAAANDLFPATRYNLNLFQVPSNRRGLLDKWRTLRRPSSYMFSPEFRAAFREALAHSHDIIHLEQLWCGWLAFGHEARTLVSVHYLLEIDLASRYRKAKHLIWEGEAPAEQPSHYGSAGASPSRIQLNENARSPTRNSANYPNEWFGLQLQLSAERRLLGRYRHYRACTERIGEAIRHRNPIADIGVAPFGFDCALYPYQTETSAPVVTLIGSMSWTPSRTAAERLLARLWPEIKRRVPDSKLRIVGWGARSALAHTGFESMNDVEVLENVADASPYFKEAGLLLYAPIRGSGMKTKIQEAMAYGIPVVTTSEGVEGLPAVDGVHAGICDDDAGLIDRAVTILSDVKLRNRMRRSARKMIEAVCDPWKTLDSTERMYQKIIERRQ